MRSRTLSVFVALMLGNMAGLGVLGLSAQVSQLPDGMKSSFDREQARVLKVFSAADGEHRFVAYLVKWKGFEVIVSDALARSDFEVGDRIRFIAQRISLAQPPAGVSSLSFGLLDAAASKSGDTGPGGNAVTPAEQQHNMKIAQGDLDAANNEIERFYALNRAAKGALAAGKTEEARKLATELERLTPKYRDDWNYGNAIQDAHQVLGRIALSEGAIGEAKRRLLASADSKGSPQMNSFGPNMQLAKDLLAQGERDVVVKYFERCSKFWKMGRDRLAAWTETVREGKTPDFGSNLKY